MFGQRVAWLRLMEDGSFHEVPYDELEKPRTEFSMPELHFISIAVNIKKLLNLSISMERRKWLEGIWNESENFIWLFVPT